MVFAEQTGRALESVDLLLHAAAEDYSTPPVASTPIVDPALGRRVRMLRQTNGVGVADRSGKFFVASSADMTQAAAALIRDTVDHPHTGLRISGPFRGPDGAWTAAMIRPVPAVHGTGNAAAVALLNLSYFEGFYQAVELTEDGAILLHLRDGTVLARLSA